MKKTLLVVSALLLTLVAVAFAEDWNEPTLTSNYADVLSVLKDRDVSSAKMDYTGDTNLPVGVLRFNTSNNRLERWDGSVWATAQQAIYDHIASTSNPHSVTAAQVGAPTSAAFTSHTGNTSNPHTVTAAQVGALRTTNNLSDVTNASTARSNIGAASASDLSSHTGASNPHSISPGSIGALAIANRLSDVGNIVSARNNIHAASQGANSDITSLSKVTDLSRDTGGTLKIGAPSNNITEMTGGWTFQYRYSVPQFVPPAPYRKDYTPWPSFTIRRSLDPSVATSQQCADAINTLWQDLIVFGILD